MVFEVPFLRLKVVVEYQKASSGCKASDGQQMFPSSFVEQARQRRRQRRSECAQQRIEEIQRNSGLEPSL